MMKRLFQSRWAKGASAFLLLAQNPNKIFALTEKLFLFLTLLLLPTQLGFHFWPAWAYVSGQRVDYLSPTIYLTDIFIFFLFFSSLYSLLRHYAPRNDMWKWWLGILGVFALLSLNVFFSLSPAVGLYGLVKLLEFVFFGWYVASHSMQVVDFLSVAFPIGILVESSLAVWQFILQHSVGGLWYFLGERMFSSSTPGIANASINGQLILRPYATFPHPNVLAGYLLLAVLFMGFSFSSQKDFRKIAYIALMVFGAIGLLISLSRTAIILGVLTCIFFGIKKLRQIKNAPRAVFFFGIGCVGFFTAVLFLLPRFIGANAFGESFILREQLLAAGWTMFVAHPLFGVGINNFFVVLPFVSSTMITIQPVHNIYLLILSQTGIIGFLLFCYFLFKTLYRCAFSTFDRGLGDNIRKFVLIFLFLFLSIGVVDHYFLTLQSGQLLTTLIFGLAWSSPVLE